MLFLFFPTSTFSKEEKASLFSLLFYTLSPLHAKGKTIKHSPPSLRSLPQHTVCKKNKNTLEKKKEKKTLRFHSKYNTLAFGFSASSFALKASMCARDSGVKGTKQCSPISRRRGHLLIRKRGRKKVKKKRKKKTTRKKQGNYRLLRYLSSPSSSSSLPPPPPARRAGGGGGGKEERGGGGE